MKNTIRLLVVVALGTLLFNSCKKEKLEGQYMPDKKLSVIRSANSLSIFHWDGKLLSDIETTNVNTGSMSKCTFTYDSKKRVEKFTVENDVIYNYKFIYNDKELTKMEGCNDNNTITDEYLFTRTDGKVTQITHHNFERSSKKGDFELLRFFFPEQIVMAMETDSRIADRAESTVTNLIWEGDNIIKTELVSTETVITNYTYDNKINPLKGLYTSNFESTLESLYSANNILTSIMPIMGINITTIHTYEYDGDYPVKDVIEIHSLGGTARTIVTYTYL